MPEPARAAVSGEPVPIPLGTPPRRERADAVRNRAAVVRAARAMLREHPGEVSMQDVADRAGVGVGTVYRRFGDRQGLLLAVLDEGEREFQRGFLRGPAPLGPGPSGDLDPALRIVAFVHELLDRTITDLEVRLALERSDSRADEPYRTWHLHLHTLCVGVGRQRVPDPDYWADLLLAALAPGLVRDQLAAGATAEALHTAVEAVVHRLLAG